MGKIKGIVKGIKGFGFALKSGVKHHSPEILMTVGTVGVVAGVVTACVQTTKVEDVLTEHETNMERIKKLREKSAANGTNEKYGKETAMVYGNTTLRMARLYAGPAVLTVASIACFFGAKRILNKRNFALAAAYTALDNSFNDYRTRVADRFGEEVDRQLRHGVTPTEVETVQVDENGNETTVKEVVNVADGNPDAFTRYFTRSHQHWDRSPDQIKWYMLTVQNDLNDLLKKRAYQNSHGVGYVTFNEALAAYQFDIPSDGSGLVMGWIYDKKNPYANNYIDIDVEPCKLPGEDGKLEQAYSMVFNVDGDIFHEMHRRDLHSKALGTRG